MLLREIKEVIKIVIFSNFIYSVSITPTKILAGFFVEVDKLMEMQGTQENKNNFEKEQNLKTYIDLFQNLQQS